MSGLQYGPQIVEKTTESCGGAVWISCPPAAARQIPPGYEREQIVRTEEMKLCRQEQSVLGRSPVDGKVGAVPPAKVLHSTSMVRTGHLIG
jgi:hypothetical protein